MQYCYGSEKLLELVSDSSKNQNSHEKDHVNEAAENDSKKETHPPLVMQASEELERLIGDGNDVSKCTLKEISKVFDLNTTDVLKYHQQQN
ncbi:hypothetical protein HanHA300_Chr12g0433121 [Helianthus annuus]|nr:hypothetical protein HanHA300_Chr12g0433121 [Helianthus annuus]KAJ0674005.1 hypothetical protein HanLR1_Chr12g0435201 [Helianthus annuus]